MSLYNMLHGRNPISGLLLSLAGLTEGDVGRLRDVYVDVEDGEPLIAVYTRNGGGNRECYEYEDDKDEAGVCHCTGCIIEEHLPARENYVRDADDEFDFTYATIWFRPIPEAREMLSLMNMPEADRPAQTWSDLISSLDKPISAIPANGSKGERLARDLLISLKARGLGDDEADSAS